MTHTMEDAMSRARIAALRRERDNLILELFSQRDGLIRVARMVVEWGRTHKGHTTGERYMIADATACLANVAKAEVTR